MGEDKGNLYFLLISRKCQFPDILPKEKLALWLFLFYFIDTFQVITSFEIQIFFRVKKNYESLKKKTEKYSEVVEAQK